MDGHTKYKQIYLTFLMNSNLFWSAARISLLLFLWFQSCDATRKVSEVGTHSMAEGFLLTLLYFLSPNVSSGDANLAKLPLDSCCRF